MKSGESSVNNFVEVSISEDDLSKIELIKENIRKQNSMAVSEDLRQELFAILNRISGGMFSDRANGVHVIRGQTNGSDFSINDHFDVSKLLDYGEMFGGKGFNFSKGNNTYVSERMAQVILIFTPENKNLQKLLRFYLNWVLRNNLPYDSSARDVDNFLNRRIFDYSDNNGYDWGQILFGAIDRLKIKPKWSQISDCIIDLRRKKVYFSKNKK